jgi:hypothetical protein
MSNSYKIMGSPGAPSFKPTKPQRNKVMLLIAAGFSESAIAAVVGISHMTLRKHFPDELEHGRARKVAENLERLEEAADGGNVSAQKYLDQKLNGHVQGLAASGKKEQRAQRAQTGHVDTEWGEVVHH